MEIITGTEEPHLSSDFLAALYQSFFSPNMSQILFGFEGGVVAQPLKKPIQTSKHNEDINFMLAIARVASGALTNPLPLAP